jgi:predicted O-methyltransferase YrrM
MDVTKKLLELDPTLERHNEGAWNEPFDPKKVGFTSFNDAGIETETGEFLYSMVRLLKPDRVLETGTHWGVGASYMGQALKDNKHGLLDTIEFLPEIHKRAKERINKLDLEKHVTCHFGDVANWNVPLGITFKLILLDTEPQTRFAELVKFEPYLEPGGFVFIHDLHQHMHQIPNEEHGFAWPFGKIPWEMRALVLEGKLKPMHFATPRGLTGFYKPHPDDYAWVTKEK